MNFDAMPVSVRRDTIKFPPFCSEVFVARITRKELKTDKFALEVGQTVTFFEEHQKEIVRYATIALGVVALIVAFMVYSRHQHAAREEALSRAIQLQEAPIGAASSPGGIAFPTQQAKDQATTQAFTSLASQFSGTGEGEIAQYYLACIAADQGKMATAEKGFLEVSQKGDANYASLAKLSLAQIYFSDGRDAQGEQLLRDVMDHPTMFVSREQATITLARFLMIKKPAEARKLLDQLKTQNSAAGQLALTLYDQISH
jgi:predicted negative regulator of RcsB-dependent stress response